MATTTSSEAGLQTFEALEIQYEHAYGNNQLKKACINEAIDLLSHKHGDNVLDVGCGTGKPVSDMLSSAGFHVTGLDISPKMIEHAKSRVTGQFEVADVLEWEPKERYGGVFIIFSLLQLRTYAEFYHLMLKYAGAVKPEGLLVVGTCPADNYVKDPKDYDSTGTYAIDYPVPFMGKDEENFVMTAKGLVDFISSMGFRIVSNKVNVFQPDDPRCVPEDQQYIIAQRVGDNAIGRPRPEP